MNSDLHNVKILVLEDSNDNRMLVGRMLTRSGASVCEAASAGEAREKMRSFAPDLILSDIGLPEEDGIEFVKKLRASADAETAKTPVIALTGYARAEEIKNLLSAGFQAHVAKPISAPLLFESIHKVLQSR